MRAPASDQSSILETMTEPAAPATLLGASSAQPLRQPLNLAAHIFTASLKVNLAGLLICYDLSNRMLILQSPAASNKDRGIQHVQAHWGQEEIWL